MTPRAWVEDLSWRAWADDALRVNRGAIVTGVLASESELTTVDADLPHRRPTSVRFTGGLWFATTGPGLHVYAEIDENGLGATCAPDLLRPLETGRR